MCNSTEHMGHSLSDGNYFFGHKCGSVASGGYVFEKLCHVLVDVTIGGCTGVHTDFACRWFVGILRWKCKCVK